jgi:hypothetical protein
MDDFHHGSLAIGPHGSWLSPSPSAYKHLITRVPVDHKTSAVPEWTR